MQDNSKGLWGRGWAFPPAFTLNVNAGPVMVEDFEDIRQSLQILFSTLPGERIMRADYGCDLNALLFENISEDLLADIRRMIRDSVLRYEPRVEPLDVTARQNNQSPTQLDVSLNYRVRGSDANRQLSGTMDIAGTLGVRFV